MQTLCAYHTARSLQIKKVVSLRKLRREATRIKTASRLSIVLFMILASRQMPVVFSL